MPNRYIRAAAIESESVNALSWQAEVLFRRLLNRVDDFGRFSAHPAIVRAAVFPLQVDRVSVSTVKKLLAECEECGILFIYESHGNRFLVMNKWEKGRASKSKYPDPDANTCKRLLAFAYDGKHMSANAPVLRTPNSEHRTPNTDNTQRPGGRGGCVPPSLPEWLDYAKTISAAWPEESARDAWDHYESVGWVIGDAGTKPVRSWKAAARRCEARWREKNGGAVSAPAEDNPTGGLEILNPTATGAETPNPIAKES